MAALSQFMSSMGPAMSNVFGGGGGVGTGAGALNFSDPMSMASQGNVAGSPGGNPSLNPAMAGMSPFEQAILQNIMQQNSNSPFTAALQGLGPLGNTLLQANILPKQIGPQAAATHGGAGQPQGINLTPPPPLMNGPLQVAQLIERLL